VTLKEYKEKLILHLSGLYGAEEIESIFFRILDASFRKSRLDYNLDRHWSIPENDCSVLLTVAKRLQKKEPIQYILGHTEFFGLLFKVDSSVLIPRQETEELVSLILKTVANTSHLKQPRLLDIGTGSGCIAVSLAHELPVAKVYATDISETSLELASFNAENNSVKVQFKQHDILSGRPINFDDDTRAIRDNKYDIVVSNPPYVRQLEKSEIHKNVLDYEPHAALFVPDEDALVFYEAIAEFARHNLKEKGMLFFEINQYLGAETKKILEMKGFSNVELIKDLFGNDRMIKSHSL